MLEYLYDIRILNVLPFTRNPAHSHRHIDRDIPFLYKWITEISYYRKMIYDHKYYGTCHYNGILEITHSETSKAVKKSVMKLAIFHFFIKMWFSLT